MASLSWSLILSFLLSPLCKVCFKQSWHTTGDKQNIFISAPGPLILYIYAVCPTPQACLNTHEWMQREGWHGVQMKRRQEHKRSRGGYGSYIFSSSPWDFSLRSALLFKSLRDGRELMHSPLTAAATPEINKQPDWVTEQRGWQQKRFNPNTHFCCALIGPNTWVTSSLPVLFIYYLNQQH